MRGPKIWKLGHVTPDHARLWVVLWSVGECQSSISVPDLKWVGQFVQSYKGSQNFEIGHVTVSHAPFEP